MKVSCDVAYERVTKLGDGSAGNGGLERVGLRVCGIVVHPPFAECIRVCNRKMNGEVWRNIQHSENRLIGTDDNVKHKETYVKGNLQ